MIIPSVPGATAALAALAAAAAAAANGSSSAAAGIAIDGAVVASVMAAAAAAAAAAVVGITAPLMLPMVCPVGPNLVPNSTRAPLANDRLLLAKAAPAALPLPTTMPPLPPAACAPSVALRAARSACARARAVLDVE